MRTQPVFALLLMLSIAAAAPAASAQEGGSSGRGRGRDAGPGGARGAGADVRRDRRSGDRGADRSPGDLRGDQRGDQRERRRERDALLAPEDRALLADRRGRGPGGANNARSPEQQAFAQALRDKRRELRAAVSAGTLDRHAAAEQLRAWLRGNGPAALPSP